MSHNYYNELWLATREDLQSLLDLDRRLQASDPTGQKDIALNSALLLYLKYRNLVKRLVLCNDQIVQAQKRELVKSVLDAAIARMLEYKRAIVKLYYTEYHWPDHILNQLKFTPDDIAIPSPRSNQITFEERRKLIQDLLENASKTVRLTASVVTKERSLYSKSRQEVQEEVAETESKGRLRRKRIVETDKVPSSLETPEEKAAREAKEEAQKAFENAMILIESHERARRSRCYANDVMKLYKYNRKLAVGEIAPKKVDRATYNQAATVIQRAWKEYLRRREAKKRIEQVEELLEMTMPSRPVDIFERDEAIFRRRLELMPSFATRTEKAVEDEKNRLWKDVGPGLTEDITDEIRQWFADWYNSAGYFDDYPAASQGGSALITMCQTNPPGFKPSPSIKKGRDAIEEEPTGRKKAKSKLEEEDEATFKWKMTSSKAFTLLQEANRDFIDKWSFRDEAENPTQREYIDIITSKLCHELQLEVRQIADELLRVELNRLNKALMKDQGEKAKKEKRKKEKKAKGGKKKGRRKKRNALDDVPIEDMLGELVQANIVRNYPLTSLNDWIGDLSYQNYEAKLQFRDYTNRLGEIKQLIMEYCILPLSSKEVHQVAPLVRSVGICGLPSSGKKFLANAICTEVGATMFDMTPQVLAGQFKGRRVQRRLIDMVNRVARAYAPSIIFLDDGEKPWLKKIPPEDRIHQPKRFARHYQKLVKAIKPGDQILFLTISSEPYKAKKPFIKVHDKFIMIPLTDYNTLYMYYKDLLSQYHGVDRNIDVSCLARMSVGVPLDFVRQAVQNVLNIERRMKLKFEPLRPQEIFEEILTYEPPTAKVMADMQKFEGRTPLGRRRRKVLEEEKAVKEQMDAMKAKMEKRQARLKK